MGKDTKIEWAEIPGHDGFRVSTEGEIQTCWVRVSLGRGNGTKMEKGSVYRTLKSRLGFDGYLMTVLRKGIHIKNHVAVLLAFVGPRPKGQEARHLDGNRRNATLANLVYGTPKENQRDQYLHGTRVASTRHPQAKLNTHQVRIARRLYADGWKQKDIGSLFGVRQPTISSLVNRKHRITDPQEAV